jgi:MoCo/4Fe-4S cofactor protein with predicted Tat translocation signal
MHIKDTLPGLYEIRRPLKKADVQRRLAGKQGKEYWRSLEELADNPEFDDLLHREFPREAAVWDESVDRRSFLKLMGASLALAGLTAGCSYQPPEVVVPYVRQPEELVPGKPLFFATAMPRADGAVGLLVRSNEGRPTHIEGNPDHPTSGTPERAAEHRVAGLDVFAQASVLSLYDPDRSQTVSDRGMIRDYTAFLATLRSGLSGISARQGQGLRFLTETVTSPTAAAQMRDILRRFPAARWHVYEPAGAQNATLGAQLAFGEPVNTVYRFDLADRVLSLDSDFLSAVGANIRHARDFINRRRVLDGQAPPEGRDAMNRLYAVETTPTNTGAKADHRLPLKPSELVAFAAAVAAQVGAGGVGAPAGNVPHADKIPAIVKDLQAHRGRSIVIPGEYAPPALHALAHAINAALGNTGQTVLHTEPIDANPVDHVQSLRELLTDIDAGQVEMLVIVGGNPVYTAPADFDFRARLEKVPFRVHLSPYWDETSEFCHWHIPETHFLETWSDARAHDGTVSIVQPLIQPLYRSRSIHEFLAAFTDRPERTGYDLVREYWQTQALGGDFEQAWRRAVHDGVVPNTQARPRAVTPRGDLGAQLAQALQAQGGGGLEVVFRPDPSVYDGRYANNGWLQELPNPLTKLTWDNAALVSPATARQLFGFSENDYTYRGTELTVPVVDVRLQGRSVRAPLVVQPGQPDGVVTVHLGYGRTRAGKVGSTTDSTTVGFNAYQIRPSNAMWYAAGAELAATGDTYPLSITQLHFNMEGRDIVRSNTLEEYARNAGDTGREHEGAGTGGAPLESGQGHREVSGTSSHKNPGPHDSMYYTEQGGYPYPGYKWGMAIDTLACVGCNSCVVACQSENNIPVVGKDQVARSREMHWIRVDAYFRGLAENPEGVYFMPVPCMHCEQAPCEPVCPVNATVHDADGTNNMVYNRCVGTRYCSNNCPYKVRRFNFLLYQDFDTPSLKLMRNPDVSVRSRGVMEKCTYCIQRIQWAKIESEKEGRRVRDGEVQPACQASCPTEAIIFGDLNDSGSRVAKLQADRRNYGLLTELGTRPRTTYLAAVRNPNPEIPSAPSTGDAHGETHG